MAEYGAIVFEKLDKIGKITLNRPQRLNAINYQLGHETLDAIRRCELDEDIRAVIFTGAGRSFCAGDDLRGMETPEFPRQSGPDEVKNYVYGTDRWTLVVHAMRRLPKPVIGSIRGHAHGGGFNLAMGTDIRIASETANFAIPFIKWAMSTGVNQLHYHVGLGLALEMAFTGDSIDAERAERLGLVNKVVPDGKLEEATMEYALRLANGPTKSIGYTKAAIYRGWFQTLDATFEHQGVAQTLTRNTEDRAEGQKAFSERRAPNYTGK